MGPEEAVVAVEKVRHMELSHMVRKMGAIVSVFEVRSDPLGNRKFQAFRDMMDVYLHLANRTLSQDVDFVNEFPEVTEEDILRINAAYERVFGQPRG